MSKRVPKEKKAQLQNAIATLSQSSNAPLLEKLARNMVDPTDPSITPQIFPSPTPGRAGAATYPVVVELDGAVSSDWGIKVRPSIAAPVLVENQSSLAFGTGVPYTGGMGFVAGSSLLPVKAMTGMWGGCEIQASVVAGRVALPLEGFAANNCTFTIFNKNSNALTVQIYSSDGITWSAFSTAVSVPGGVGASATRVSLWDGASKLYFAFDVASNGGNSIASSAEYSISGDVGIRPYEVPTIMDTFAPEWSGLLDNIEEARIVAMSALVTYKGATLNNSGQIAVCNADEHLPIVTDFFTTCAQRPFDKYDGRLASEGESPGGAHWHYIPDSPEALTLGKLGEDISDRMVGYFGIKGMSSVAGTIVKLRVDITVNFFSTDPQYRMSFQPAYRGFSELISLLRREVPLCSSNDDHLKKIVKAARAMAKKAGMAVLDNPEKVFKALSLMATMV